MSATGDILRTYRAPGTVVRRLLTAGQREDRVLAYLMIACGLIFVAQWPRLARDAALDDSIPFEGRLAGALFGWIFVAPIFFYGLAAVSRLVAQVFGGKGTFYSARLALFWTLLVLTPLFLFAGLAVGFGVTEGAQAGIGVVIAAAFLFIWGGALWATERPGAVASAHGAQ